MEKERSRRFPSQTNNLRARSFSLFLLSVLAVSLMGCARGPTIRHITSPAQQGSKVLIIGMSGINWRDLVEASSPVFDEMARDALVANVSVRVSNHPADAWATLGAGQRTHTDPSAGWAFNVSERVENGTADAMYERRTGEDSDGEVVVPTIGQILELNVGTAFNAEPGALLRALGAEGKTAAVIGNADYSLGGLPRQLPNQETMRRRDLPDVGIHREAALAVMNPDGTVSLGDVSRELLRDAPSSPYGISADRQALLSEFRRVWQTADLVVVELGETFRADSYSVGMPEAVQKRIRIEAIRRSADLTAALINDVDPTKDVVMIFSATTPGGAQERGQLRPMMMRGAGVPNGAATSSSTQRGGLVTVPDLTVTIAQLLGVSGPVGQGGHVIGAVEATTDSQVLAELNDRAVTHDKLRNPIAAIFVGLQLIVFALTLIFLARAKSLPGGIIFGLLVLLSFPAASFIPRFVIWRWGAVWAGVLIGLGSILLALAAYLIAQRRPPPAATLIIGVTAVWFAVDLIMGTPGQLDSVLGYTSVAAGRFYGLGNLGFAIFASTAIILASSLAGSKRMILWAPVLAVALVMIGLPQLGNDVGGTITMFTAIAVFAYVLSRRRSLPAKLLPVVLIASVVILVAFAFIDFARPPGERTHIGDFLAQALADPSYVWLVIQRKIGLAVSLAVSSRWGIGVPLTAAVLIWLYRKRRAALKENFALRAALEALIVVAVLGSLVNDSGVAVAGMVFALAVPWALLAQETRQEGP